MDCVMGKGSPATAGPLFVGYAGERAVLGPKALVRVLMPWRPSMTNQDPTPDQPTEPERPASSDPVPPATETEHIEDDGEPLGANFA